ncbi:hypothetical protein LINPERHAP1_LOCUS36281 [Linum perenne]
MEAIALDLADWSSLHRPPNSNPSPDQAIAQIPHHRPHNSPPPSAPFRVYCDGSFLNETQTAAFGLVITNTDGQICDGRSGRFMSTSLIASEARAILEAAIYATRSPRDCCILSDCKTLIDCLYEPESCWPWDCYGTIGCISRIIQSHPSISFHFIRRRFNSQADWVAKLARLGTLPSLWWNVIPASNYVSFS